MVGQTILEGFSNHNVSMLRARGLSVSNPRLAAHHGHNTSQSRSLMLVPRKLQIPTCPAPSSLACRGLAAVSPTGTVPAGSAVDAGSCSTEARTAL